MFQTGRLTLMAFISNGSSIRQSSPHKLGLNSTQRVMSLLILATLPGLLAQTVFFGWGTVVNVLWCVLIALGCEALVLILRRRSVRFCSSYLSARRGLCADSHNFVSASRFVSRW